MICPDCGLEVDKLNRKGICKKCAIRKNQIDYLNRKNGTNKPYTPLIEIKDENPSLYYRLIDRRKDNTISMSKTDTKTNNEITEESTEKSTNIRNKYYAKVAKDIKAAFDKANLSEDYLTHNDLDKWLETFYSLLQETNFVLDAKKGEQIFNDLFILYKHSQEDLDWGDIDKIQELGFAQKALSEIRRPTKELLDYYSALSPAIDYLKQDKEFMSIISKCRESMLKKSINHSNPKYHTNLDSIIANTDNIIVSEDYSKNIKLFYGEVACFNLFGNKTKQIFRTNKGIYAKDLTDAKLKFKTFLANKFPSITYKDIDIELKEVSSQSEIDELVLSRKESL